MHDGPASLPRVCFNTDPANTPSPGPSVRVAAGESLQTAYNAAECGTTILLAHGATWDDPFDFPAKNCDDQHWITIKTDGVIPPPGVRISEDFISQMAHLNMRNRSGFRSVGDHLRFEGLYFTKALSGVFYYLPALLKDSNKIIFDRVYVHCQPAEECQHGITISTAKYVAVIDSMLDEFHCIAKTGACVDSQAISGGAADQGSVRESGPVKIVNNLLEASGENIMFGGARADGPGPNDVEIRRNYLLKDAHWNPNDPDFIGVTYIVKNCFELKNGTHLLFEANVCDHVWGGFTQAGFAILLTPKNQAGAGGSNLCPRCAVDDVTMRYNVVHQASGAIMIASGMSDNKGWSDGEHRISLHDTVFDDLQYPGCYSCGQFLVQLGSDYDPANPPDDGDVLSDVSIRNNTIIAVSTPPSGVSGLLMMSGIPPEVETVQVANVAFVDNLASTLGAGAYFTGGGSKNCATGFYAKPVNAKTMWKSCYIGDSPFTGNVLVSYPKLTTDWPEGNLFSPNWLSVGFDSLSDGVYSLQRDSAYVGKGANIDAVNLATFGVR